MGFTRLWRRCITGQCSVLGFRQSGSPEQVDAVSCQTPGEGLALQGTVTRVQELSVCGHVVHTPIVCCGFCGPVAGLQVGAHC